MATAPTSVTGLYQSHCRTPITSLRSPRQHKHRGRWLTLDLRRAGARQSLTWAVGGRSGAAVRAAGASAAGEGAARGGEQERQQEQNQEARWSHGGGRGGAGGDAESSSGRLSGATATGSEKMNGGEKRIPPRLQSRTGSMWRPAARTVKTRRRHEARDNKAEQARGCTRTPTPTSVLTGRTPSPSPAVLLSNRRATDTIQLESRRGVN